MRFYHLLSRNKTLAFIAGILIFLSNVELSKAQLSLNPNNCYINVKTGTNLHVDGNITLGSNGQIDNSGEVEVKGDLSNNSGTTGFTDSYGTLRFTGDNQSIGGSSATTLNNIIFLGAGSKTLNNTSQLTINGFLIAGDSGTSNVLLINLHSNPIFTGGNFTINSGSTYQENGAGFNVLGNVNIFGNYTGTKKLFFSGSNVQTISGAALSELKSLTINKSGGHVLLNETVAIDSMLTLTKGVIVSDTSHLLVINNGAIVSGASDSSYVSGPVKKIGNTAFTFPLGDNSLTTGAFHPLSITTPVVATDAFTAQYFAKNVLSDYPSDTIIQTDSIASISNCEYWNLKRSAGSSEVIPSLDWNVNSCNVQSASELLVSGWNGNQWKSFGNAGTSSNGNTGRIIAKDSIEGLLLPVPIHITIGIGILKVSAGIDKLVCLGNSTTLTASVSGSIGSVSYSWSPSTGLNSTNILQPIATPTVTTTYKLTVTETAFLHRHRSDSVIVIVHQLPTVTASSNTAICLGSSTTLTASGANTYAWSPSTGLSSATGTSVTASPNSTTTYIITGTDTSGCIDTATAMVIISSLPTVSVSPSNTTSSICSAGVTLTASGANTYSWSPATGLSSTTGTTVTASPTSTTTYTVTGTSSSGCVDTATALITVTDNITTDITANGFTSFTTQCSDSRFPPVVCNYFASACIDSVITLSASVCTNPNLVYSWNMGNNAFLTGSSISYTYNAVLSDTITLTITDTTGHLSPIVKQIPISVYNCLIVPSCCSDPHLYVTNKATDLDTAISISGKLPVILCKNLVYNLRLVCAARVSNAEEHDTINVRWILSDNNFATADTSYSGINFSISLSPGTYSLTVITSGTACDSTYITKEIQIVNCNEITCSDCIKSFAPIPAKKYMISAWTKQSSGTLLTTYSSPKITVSSTDSSYAVSFTPSGSIIDGWQKIDGEFTLPGLATDIQIKLECTSSGDCFFDDIRVFPFDGSIKSYVYDPVNMRLVAELDERNYATLYEYDEEGKLVRVKKETEKGIMTIKENRNNTSKIKH